MTHWAGLSTRPRQSHPIIALSIRPTRRSLSCCAFAPSRRAIPIALHASPEPSAMLSTADRREDNSTWSDIETDTDDRY
jgi:hypothetical protein